MYVCLYAIYYNCSFHMLLEHFSCSSHPITITITFLQGHASGVTRRRGSLHTKVLIIAYIIINTYAFVFVA